MTKSLKPFDRPQQTIDHAKEAFAELVQEWQSDRCANLTKAVVEFDSKTREKVYKCKTVRPIPAKIERLATEVLNNLKNSFDQSLFALCAAIDEPVKDAHYPWTDSITGLEARRNSANGKRLSAAVWDEIFAQAPYKRGDFSNHDLVRELAALANAKHTIGFELGGMIAQTVGFNGVISIAKGGSFTMNPPAWDAEKQEVELGRSRGAGRFKQNYQLTSYVAFAGVPALRNVSAFGALELMIGRAQYVLDRFRAFAVRSGAA